MIRTHFTRDLAALVLAATAGLAAALPAYAQSGSGAERYEVTITPPKRPGPEPESGTGTVSEKSGTGTVSTKTGTGSDPATPGNDPGAAGAAAAADTATPSSAPGAAPATPSPETAAVPEAAAVATGPLRSLQVGAFRAQKSAASLHDALTENFENVEVIEAQSGGEPIFRVNVGRLPRGPALEDLKRRLVAAGYPTFEVLAPTGESAAR